MRKQYVVSVGATFRYLVTTYHDGVEVESIKVWLGDELDNLTDRLELEGYERAFTKEKVQEAKERYEWFLARQLMEEVR